jgi:nucleoside-diphosphate-sugar epimerase
MARILVSGSTGFIGRNLFQYLEAHNLKAEELNLRHSLSKDLFSNAKNGSVVHLAGKAHDLKKTASPDGYFTVNFGLTKDLFDLFLSSEATKFIYVSSVKAVADKVTGILKEDDVPHPSTYYGKSKLMAEEYLLSQNLPYGKSCFILRLCMVHGPGNKGNLNILHKIISKGIPYPLASFENKRSFLSIENLCFVIYELLSRNDIPSGVYNVADDEELSTNELIKLIGAAANKSIKFWNIKPELIKFIAKLGDKLHLPLTTERLEKLTENYVVDNSKLKNALGKNFPVSSKEGMLATMSSFQS